MKCALPILLLMLTPALAMGQPGDWTPTPTNAAGTLLGTVTVGGAAAQTGDWVAAFDAGGTCAGATEVVLNAGQSFISLPIYGDDATTPDVDEGMGGGEAFTLRLWRASTGEVLFHPTPEAPLALTGWTATNGAPMPGFDDAYVVYDFAYDGPTLTVECPPETVCLDGSVFNLTATPDNGAWSGPGVLAGFAGYFFDPAVAGLGTHTLTYTAADGTTESCTVTVTEYFTPTLELPLGWCQGDAPLALDGLGQPEGGTWTGDGVLNTADGPLFDAGVLTPGTVALTYTVDGPCGGVATGNLSVFPSPEPPGVYFQYDILEAINVAVGDSIHWWLGEGDGLYSIGYTDPLFYFPTWETAYYVEAINEYGCSTFSPPLLLSGVPEAQADPLRLWMKEGQLNASSPLQSVRWFDALGRALEGPQGPGPWLVHAVAADGRTARRLLH